ncbi:MarR family winged helix-turn-helix transcriptional regulator [Flavobacterium agricola]|uniref:MarR family winged helix-turn-helix transcriptional regulator n=1 Tax=Flavobacterium agricola TaxID=2870839 RepID=A0ABY6M1T5_9FLAO|nr:helix-turn-helix domain-containing protein [Flavobacterium agricola]UYW02474.1 MarR family winged helix-turn-helix transcriptional regulator [Flavobacterium agricola]
MKYELIKDVLDLVAQFEIEKPNNKSVDDFKKWISASCNENIKQVEPYWEGKENGRSAESVINTLLVHLNRYAKNYSKSAIFNSNFSTQEDFIYLITLKAFGEMSKMELIKKNVHEKTTGMQIINRLIANDWIEQYDSIIDRRSKLIKITQKGLDDLEKQMSRIRIATQVVAGDLDNNEKMQLIHLLNKLNNFHLNIYEKNIDTENLLNEVLKTKNNA